MHLLAKLCCEDTGGQGPTGVCAPPHLLASARATKMSTPAMAPVMEKAKGMGSMALQAHRRGWELLT